MNRRSTRGDIERISQVLDGLAYPAEKWKILMHAEAYGADARTRAQLWALPPGSHVALSSVLGALGLGGGLLRPMRRAVPTPTPVPPRRSGPVPLPVRSQSSAAPAG